MGAYGCRRTLIGQGEREKDHIRRNYIRVRQVDPELLKRPIENCQKLRRGRVVWGQLGNHERIGSEDRDERDGGGLQN